MPLSPLHATHANVFASQNGVATAQFEVLPAVHWRQRPAPPPADSSQRPLRQVPLAPDAVAWTHPPSPLGRPQTLSAPQTPLEQRFEFPAVQVPPPGIVVPVSPFAWQVCATVSHHWFEEQSPSTLHPAAGRHVPLVEHAPDRQTTAALPFVHGPVPFAKPQRLSPVSQTPLVHTAVAACTVHTPFSVGFVCEGTFGMATPLARSAVHVALGDAPVSHHWAARQLPSFTQALPHAPVAWQMPPEWVAPMAVQVAVPPEVPHDVHVPPPPGQ